MILEARIMRQLAEVSNANKILLEREREEIGTAIYTAAEEGKYFIKWNGFITYETRMFMLESGYRIRYIGNQMEMLFEISWEDAE